jgi:D-beta-D-heptose 7-phosphate kinase/D-beta-D-heptose 1-phosphate adenosyltransferase
MAFEEPATAAVHALLKNMAGRRVLVIGDGMLDCYIYGASSRISPEAPVQIVQAERSEELLGGAANAAKCLVALGANVSLCCIIGEDAEGERFLAQARSLRMDTSLVRRDPNRPTATKTRIVCGRQHILRVDREARSAGRTPPGFPPAIQAAAQEVDAILLSDYNKGILDETVCAAAIAGAKGRPVLVDPKGDRWERYRGATVVKPNWREALSFLKAHGHTADDKPAADAQSEAAAGQLRRDLRAGNILLSRAEHGVSLACADGATLSFRARAEKVEDEAGAGDTLGAATCLALAAGAPFRTAAWLGNIAAGAKVAKFGTLTVSSHDILSALGEQFAKSERKCMTAGQAAQFAAALRSAGKKVVFTNGCFDILHIGHRTLLQEARQLGDALIVGINTDASVKRLKGPQRPINSEADRAGLLSAMEFVDAVVLFNEDTPLELLKAIKPDVLCKGGDYRGKEEVVGWEVVESCGGKVALINLVEGRSTTKTIEKARGEKR